MKILIADDHPFTLQGTKSFVESCGFKVTDTCSNGIAALNLIILHQPDIAILDINMPGLDGLDIAQKIQKNKIRTKVVLLTMHDEAAIYKRALSYGIYGYILKENAQKELDQCLHEVIKGKIFTSALLGNATLEMSDNDDFGGTRVLTFSEKKILDLIAQEKTSKQIASSLFLSEKTVEGHRSKIIEKLGLAKEKNALLKWALRNYKN